MDLVKSCGLMGVIIEENIEMEKNVVRVCTTGQMVPITKEIGNLIRCMEKETSFGQMAENLMEYF